VEGWGVFFSPYLFHFIVFIEMEVGEYIYIYIYIHMYVCIHTCRVNF